MNKEIEQVSAEQQCIDDETFTVARMRTPFGIHEMNPKEPWQSLNGGCVIQCRPRNNTIEISFERREEYDAMVKLLDCEVPER